MKIYKLVNNAWEYIECEDVIEMKIQLESEWEIVHIEEEVEGGNTIIYNTLW